MEGKEPRQLKLSAEGEKQTAKREKKIKEKEPKSNKWWLFLIFLLTVVVSLVFSFVNRADRSGKTNKTAPLEEKRGIFAPKVYEF